MKGIRHLAKQLNVSIGTVSKALNNNGRLRGETRERVLSAARRLGYRPNDLAQSLHRGQSLTVGLISTDAFGRFTIPIMEGVEECLTDSRNRTAPEIRNLFKTGSLGQPGSVAFFFNHLGVVEATHPDADRDAEADAIEAGAQEIEPLEADEVPAGQKGARFLTEIKDLDHVSKALKAAGWNIIASEIRYLAKNFVEVGAAARKDVTDFLNALDDHDDVHRVYAAMK